MATSPAFGSPEWRALHSKKGAPAKSKGKPAGKGEIPNTAANTGVIVDKIEAKKGPVGPGHHNSHRTAALERWLEQKRKK